MTVLMELLFCRMEKEVVGVKRKSQLVVPVQFRSPVSWRLKVIQLVGKSSSNLYYSVKAMKYPLSV